MIQDQLPDDISAIIGDAPLLSDKLGRSICQRFYVGDFAFLKCQQHEHPDSLSTEAATLNWIKEYLPAAPVLAATSDVSYEYLLTELLPGFAAQSLSAEEGVSIYAETLTKLHQIPTDLCPFNQTLAVMVNQAQHRVEQGWVNEFDFEAEYLGHSALDLFEHFTSQEAPGEDLVVCHGDYCLPNLMIAGNRTSGLIDTGSLGVADRYHDLALAERSIRHNWGAKWIRPFYEAYGLPWSDRDQRKVEYYTLLDEFF